MIIEFSTHALEKMLDRGASQIEVEIAIRTGSSEPARNGRFMFRKTFIFNREWRGKNYAVKQVAAIVAQKTDSIVVVTVLVFYY